MYGFALHKNSIMASVTGRRVEQAKRLEENPDDFMHRKPALERRLKRRANKTPIEVKSRESARQSRVAEEVSDSGVNMFEMDDLMESDDAANILMAISQDEVERQKTLDNLEEWDRMFAEKCWMLC